MLAAMGAVVAAWMSSAVVMAQAPARWPDKPVHMVVAFPPGGPLDLVARQFAAPLAERFNQPFLVENRPGAAGNIGMDAVAKAAPDGYTLLWTLDSMLTVNPTVYKIEPLERLRPVALVTQNTAVMVVNTQLKATTPAEFAKLSLSSDFSYSSAGIGSPGHRQMELFKYLSGAKVTHVPYSGNAPAVQSVVAGETQVFITPIAGALQQIRAGRLRALAVTSAKRTSILPDVPTMVESGYPRFVVVAWFGLMAPVKTPQPVVDTLERELARIVALPAVRDSLAKAGQEPITEPAAALLDRVKEERRLWADVIEKTGMKLE